MIVKVLVFGNETTGLGHWYRSMALADHLWQYGHAVTIISDRQPHGKFPFHQVAYEDQTLWLSPLQNQCDWLIIDLPNEAPAWLYDHCQAKGIRTLILNGVGHQVGDRADLRIVQGLTEDNYPYSGVDYIILRDSVFKAKAVRNPIIDWFVFGGAADKMGLTRHFPNWQRISFSVSDSDWQATDNHDNGFLMAASQCRRACVAMGMTVLEIAAWGDLPTYVFSVSETHLRFAKSLEAAGYIKAWPNVGRAVFNIEMEEFLQEPFSPMGKPIDGRAVDRIRALMMKG